MYVLNYAWHGFVLNDYMRLSIPLETYFVMASIVYLVIGLVITTVSTFINTGKHLIRKGTLVGVAIGFFIYLIAFVLGVSFHSNSQMEHIAIDFAWQMAEQGAGGFLCGFVFRLFPIHSPATA
ncbi:MAG: hypothetical protein COA57_03270 [Flavobacteriales bacterium]|nr:MAG: hypothetical protein COA57_03270 [Flavobacteriales bacterium]